MSRRDRNGPALLDTARRALPEDAGGRALRGTAGRRASATIRPIRSASPPPRSSCRRAAPPGRFAPNSSIGSAGESAILPVIRPLGEIDEDAGFFEPATPAALDLDPPIGSVAAAAGARPPDPRLEGGAARRSFPHVHAGNPLIAPANPADAVWLARGLADLMEAMETEERPWSALGGLDAADHAAWWQLTLEFLKIATDFWPRRLAELHRSSPAAHRNAALRAEARRLSASPPGRSGDRCGLYRIAAGDRRSHRRRHEARRPARSCCRVSIASWPTSTGSWSAGAPNADQSMAVSDDPATRTHPQYGLCRLLEKLGHRRDDVVELAAPPPRSPRATASCRWLCCRRRPRRHGRRRRPAVRETIAAALADISLIEARNEREEAQAIAVAMRYALEGGTPESQVALVTPDRGLARRVAIELSRFGIEADDSAGTPLASTAQGGLLTADCRSRACSRAIRSRCSRFSSIRSPGSACPPARCRRAARALELVALRSGAGEVDAATLALLVGRAAGRRPTGDRHQPLWRSRIGAADIALARDLAGRVERAVGPLATAPRPQRDETANAAELSRFASGRARRPRSLEAVAARRGRPPRPSLGRRGRRGACRACFPASSRAKPI